MILALNSALVYLNACTTSSCALFCQSLTHMKRILLSLLCGIIFLVGYLFVIYLLDDFFEVENETIVFLIQPLNFPYEIYKKLFGIYYGRRVVVSTVSLISIVLMLSGLSYLILALYARLTKKSEIISSEIPSEPPKFD